MKVVLALLLGVIIVVNVATFWQLEQLRLQVRGFEKSVGISPTGANSGNTDASLEQAVELMNEAQAAAQKAQFSKAKGLIRRSLIMVNEFGKQAGASAQPVVRWLTDQGNVLQKQMERQRL